MLNRRLNAIASLIDPCDTLIDIGSDHGYLPLQLIKDGRINSAVLSELRLKPLEQAKKHFKTENLSDKAQFVISNGISSIDTQVDNVVIAGLGYDTTIQIIEQDLERFKQCSQIILQSNSKVDLLRIYMHSKQFALLNEVSVIDRKHTYIALKYRYTGETQALSETELLYGPILTASITDDYRYYLETEYLRVKELLHTHKDDILKKEQILADLLAHS